MKERMMLMSNKMFMRVEDVAEEMGVSMAVLNRTLIYTTGNTARNVSSRIDRCVHNIAVFDQTVFGNELTHNSTGTNVVAAIHEGKALDA